jgi:hypothetical protein
MHFGGIALLVARKTWDYLFYERGCQETFFFPRLEAEKFWWHPAPGDVRRSS